MSETANHKTNIGEWQTTGEPCWDKITFWQRLKRWIKKLFKINR